MINKNEYLGPKHTGMMISCSGILGRIAKGWKVDAGLRYGCEVLLDHLEKTAKRFYEGDIKAVDEFLQLYCLDGYRSK